MSFSSCPISVFRPVLLWTSVLSLAYLQLLLLLISCPTTVVSHGFSPDLLPRHFDERMLRDLPPSKPIRITAKNGTKKKMAQVEKNGQKEWKWVKEGEEKKKEEPAKKPWRAKDDGEKKKEASGSSSGGRELWFDPPTPKDQAKWRDKLAQDQDIGTVRLSTRDVYKHYHRVIRKSDNNKKIVPSKTVPARIADIKYTKNNFYRAMAYALAGTEKLYKGIREKIADYFERVWSKKDEPWMAELEIRSRRKHSQKIRNGEVVGGRAEMVAAAKRLDINILVYNTSKDEWWCMSPSTEHKEDIEKQVDCQDKAVLTIALELTDDDRYTVIVDVEEK